MNPQWVSVNNAVYVCYGCTGRHRGFGVQTSFIRSLCMDIISDRQRHMLSIGGNQRFKEFMATYGLNSEPRKYETRAAEFYRGVIKALAERTDYRAKVPEYEEGRMIICKGIKKWGGKARNVSLAEDKQEAFVKVLPLHLLLGMSGTTAKKEDSGRQKPVPDRCINILILIVASGRKNPRQQKANEQQ